MDAVVDGNTFPTIAVVRLKWGQVELFGSWQQTSSNGEKRVIKMQLEAISGLNRCLGAQLAISVHNCPVLADTRFPMSIFKRHSAEVCEEGLSREELGRCCTALAESKMRLL